jgi:hypothetical protein
MKKLVLLLLVLILTSCGARKVDVSKIEIKKDSIVETKVLVTTIENKIKTDSTNIVTTIDNSEIVITPIDTCKEIVVEGKVYKNVVLRIKKNKVNTLYTNNKTESNNKRKDSVAIIKVQKKEHVVAKNKKIDKPANHWWILWLLLLILTLYQLWRNRLSLLKLL